MPAGFLPVRIAKGRGTAMNHAMKCCVIAVLAVLPVSAVAAEAGGFLHLSALRDVHDDNGRAAIGVALTLPVATLNVRALGEIGAPISNNPGLDSRFELTAGWPLRAGTVRATPFAGGGYRRWSAERPFERDIDTGYLVAGAGAELVSSSGVSAFGEVAVQHLNRYRQWCPRAEVGIAGAVIRYSLFYEKLRHENGRGPDIYGLKMGIGF